MFRKTGEYEGIGQLNYFVPDQLPPQNPLLKLDGELLDTFGRAMQQLGQLNEMAKRLPDIKRFIKAYVIKEALLSSAIEGIHTTLMDVYASSLSVNKASKQTQLVMNYVTALDTGVNMIEQEGMPISSRIILNTHKALMSVGEGDHASPGEYRKQSVRVGDLIPPPAQKVPSLINSLEKFINEDVTLPPLVKAGLAHVQFETIHPFLDGNGRIGRLLIVLMLIDSRILSAPILYPSYYFKKYHLEYYQNLDIVRTEGNFERWLLYYLQAIEASSLDAYQRAREIEALEAKLKQLILNSHAFTKVRESALNTLLLLFTRPFISVSDLAKDLRKSYNTASKLITLFVNEGFLHEIPTLTHKRNKLFRFAPYLEILEKEYE